MVYHDLPLGWLTLCKPASMQITLRINTSEIARVAPATRTGTWLKNTSPIVVALVSSDQYLTERCSDACVALAIQNGLAGQVSSFAVIR